MTSRGVGSNHRDLVIETLADSEHALAGEAARLREALHLAVVLVHEGDVGMAALRARYRRLMDDHRSMLAEHRGRRVAA